MKEIPKVFQNNVNKNFNNNEKVFYSKDINSKEDDADLKSNKNIVQKINEIFSSPNYIYKSNVEITLKDKKIKKRIIGRNKNYIITMENDLIPISDIIEINHIKKNK